MEEFIFCIGLIICLVISTLLVFFFTLGVFFILFATIATGWDGFNAWAKYNLNPFGKKMRKKYSLIKGA